MFTKAQKLAKEIYEVIKRILAWFLRHLGGDARW